MAPASIPSLLYFTVLYPFLHRCAEERRARGGDTLCSSPALALAHRALSFPSKQHSRAANPRSTTRDGRWTAATASTNLTLTSIIHPDTARRKRSREVFYRNRATGEKVWEVQLVARAAAAPPAAAAAPPAAAAAPLAAAAALPAAVPAPAAPPTAAAVPGATAARAAEVTQAIARAQGKAGDGQWVGWF